MKIVALIPAHLKSIRFPNKILLKIHGLEMIEHVRRRAVMSESFDNVYVATGDEEIISVVKSNNGDYIKTNKKHLSGSSRVIEAIKELDEDVTHIVLIQGDEPLVLPNYLKKMCEKIIENPKVNAWNVTSELINESQLKEHSIVKCVINEEERILYCFRNSPSFLPFEIQKKYIKKILGLIAFEKETIMNFEDYNPSKLEQSESIEQLRLIENGFNLISIPVDSALPSINEPNDYLKVLDYIKSSKIQQKILRKIIEKY